MNDTTVKWLKAGGAIVALLLVVLTVNNWLGDYRRASDARERQAAVEASASATESPTAKEGSEADGAQKASDPAEKTSSADKPDLVVVKIDGLNLRKDPNQVSDSIVGLEKGQKLTLIKKSDGWYQVETADGQKGWVSSKSSYTKIEKQ